MIASQTENYSGADLENICREAGMQAIREWQTNENEEEFLIEKRHFKAAMENIQPSLTDDIIKHYRDQAKEVSTMRSRHKQRPEDRLYQ